MHRLLITLSDDTQCLEKEHTHTHEQISMVERTYLFANTHTHTQPNLKWVNLSQTLLNKRCLVALLGHRNTGVIISAWPGRTPMLVVP